MKYFHHDKNAQIEDSDKIDWHDWDYMEQQNYRVAIGEHGVATYLRIYPESSKLINDTYGYNGYLGDKIALNRTLKDLRPEEYDETFIP